MNKRILALVAVVPVTALILTACGSNASTTGTGAGASMPMGGHSSTATTAHNPSDVTFAQSMIPHHQQAVEMAKFAATRASDPRVKDLAARIEAAQDPEIATMTAWLTAWGAAAPGDMAGMDGMPGMMSTADLTALGAATGTAFDTAFLTMMIAHHTGALTMAQAELTNGADAEAKALAQSIVDGQTKEIAVMKALLGG